MANDVERDVLDSLGEAWRRAVDVCSTCQVALRALAQSDCLDAEWARRELERLGWGERR